MRLLLDTHALLWWVDDDPKLSPQARLRIADERSECYISVVSAWEMAIEVATGWLPPVSGSRCRCSGIFKSIWLPTTSSCCRSAWTMRPRSREPAPASSRSLRPAIDCPSPARGTGPGLGRCCIRPLRGRADLVMLPGHQGGHQGQAICRKARTDLMYSRENHFSIKWMWRLQVPACP